MNSLLAELLGHLKDPSVPCLVVHHGNCVDGFSAAYAAWSCLGPRARYLPIVHGQTLPAELETLEDGIVLMLDYCLPQPLLGRVVAKARLAVLLDHHASNDARAAPLLQRRQLKGFLDTGHSAAILAWQFFRPDVPLPVIFEYAEDLDFWCWRQPQSALVANALASYPKTFATWQRLSTLTRSEVRALLAKEGEIIQRYQDQLIAELADAARYEHFLGIKVPVVNAPVLLFSPLGDRFTQEHPFFVGYADMPGYRAFGLRSSESGMDVKALCMRLGGGGHARAAGCELSFDHLDPVSGMPGANAQGE